MAGRPFDPQKGHFELWQVKSEGLQGLFSGNFTVITPRDNMHALRPGSDTKYTGY